MRILDWSILAITGRLKSFEAMSDRSGQLLLFSSGDEVPGEAGPDLGVTIDRAGRTERLGGWDGRDHQLTAGPRGRGLATRSLQVGPVSGPRYPPAEGGVVGSGGDETRSRPDRTQEAHETEVRQARQRWDRRDEGGTDEAQTGQGRQEEQAQEIGKTHESSEGRTGNR